MQNYVHLEHKKVFLNGRWMAKLAIQDYRTGLIFCKKTVRGVIRVEKRCSRPYFFIVKTVVNKGNKYSHLLNDIGNNE